MPFKLEDGKGSRFRAGVVVNRLKTSAVSVSPANYVSQEPIENNNPNVGVYEVRAVSSVAGSGSSLIYLVNNNPVNLVLIDRIYTNEILSAISLPDSSTYISVIMRSVFASGTGTSLFSVNVNNAIADIQPNVTILNGAVTSGGVESYRTYLNTNRVYFQEPLPQKVDGIILATGNSIELFLNTLSSTTIETNMRYMLMDKGGLKNVV